MSFTSDQLFNNFKIIANSVKKDLKKKGLVIPIKNLDGSISVEDFIIDKDSTGFFIIKNKKGNLVVNNINLPQTAMLLANGLALGKMIDTRLCNLDRDYGFKKFEEQLFYKRATQSLKNNNIDRADFLFTRFKIVQSQTNVTKSLIQRRFEKLCNLH
jgi:hypothetical protein